VEVKRDGLFCFGELFGLFRERERECVCVRNESSTECISMSRTYERYALEGVAEKERGLICVMRIAAKLRIIFF